MATIVPFRGVLYDPARVPDVSRVVAPPYDVIDPPAQRALHDRHPHNVIRLELGLDQAGDNETRNKYTRAADHLRDWLRTGVLRRDREPAVYFYSIDYRAPAGGAARTLRGFLTTVALEEFGTGRIFPHEDTRASAKKDRLQLLERCHANFSPIFSLCPDPEAAVFDLLEKSVEAGRPRIDFIDDEGFRQRLWTIADRAVLHDLAAMMNPKPLFIADGHHRYETALAYRRARRQQEDAAPGQPYDHVLMLISSLEDEGLTVLPTHRVLQSELPAPDEIRERLRSTFDIEAIPFEHGGEHSARSRLLRRLETLSASTQAFGLARRGLSAYWILSVKPEYRHPPGTSARDRLDVSVLHERVLKPLLPPTTDPPRILYTKDADEALDAVQSGSQEARAALLLNPTKVSEVRAVAAAGDRMPHKSTYFFPKPLTGLVMNVFEEQ